MTTTNIYEEWQKLCEQHEAARDAHFEALENVTRKFVGIGQGKSIANPSMEDLTKFEETWQAWEEIKNKMSEFVKKNA